MLDNPDESFLIHQIEVAKSELNDYDTQVYLESETIAHVRVDEREVYSGSGSQRQKVGNATIYIYAFNQPGLVIDDTWLDARVTFHGKEFLIKSINTYSQVGVDETYSWELGVI